MEAALRAVLGARRFGTEMERVLFALVANRAVDPCSKLAAAEWASCHAALSGLGAMDDDHAYRAMGLLVEADATAQVQEAAFFAAADLLSLEVDVLLLGLDVYLLGTSHRGGRRGRPSAATSIPRTTARTCRRL